jgi:hypothetical protein
LVVITAAGRRKRSRPPRRDADIRHLHQAGEPMVVERAGIK